MDDTTKTTGEPSKILIVEDEKPIARFLQIDLLNLLK